MSAAASSPRRWVAALDTAALEALANRGLLRRAQKDLDRGIATEVGTENPAELRVRVAEFEVILPESGPAAASCSCPASGVCQHLLAAILFLQRTAPPTDGPGRVENAADTPNETETKTETAAPAPPGPTVPEIPPDALERWAGKASFKAGLRIVAAGAPEIFHERTVRVRFPVLNAEVHFVPGTGLDGAIVAGGRTDSRALVVAAVIGVHRAAGKEWNVPLEDPALEASAGAPRDREGVLASCAGLLQETLHDGLSRVSDAHRQRWVTLAMSALAVNLPRLAAGLRSVGDEVGLAVTRQAHSDLSRTLARMSEVHALCAALAANPTHPRPDLVGVHRTRYDEIGNVELAGVAAWPWRTASGYDGLTVLFRDVAGRGWNSWSESRPRAQSAGFNPVARYTQPGPWDGADSPHQLARSTFRLMNARRNPARRLSASGKTRALVTGPVAIASLGIPIVEDWSSLPALAARASEVGLKEANPLDAVGVIRPSDWGPRHFDPVSQTFDWRVADVSGNPLPLVVEFGEFTGPGIRYLETISPEWIAGALVVGRPMTTPSGLVWQPWSLHLANGAIVHLGLDTVKPVSPGTAAATATVVESEAFEWEGEEDVAGVETASPELGRLYDTVGDELLALAESGLASPARSTVELLAAQARRARRLGLKILAEALDRVVRSPRPEPVLRGFHILQRHRQADPS